MCINRFLPFVVEQILKVWFWAALFCRLMVENKKVNSEPEKSSFSATDASAMKYVSLAFVIVSWIQSSYGSLTFASDVCIQVIMCFI